MDKLKFIILLFMLCYSPIIAGEKHPLHVSTTEVNYNQSDKTLEISSRIFTDDFESILAKLNKEKIDLSKPSMKTRMDDLVKKYLITHLQIKANGKPVSMKYIGFEIDHEATNIYFEVEKISQLKSIELTNTILYDLFVDQMSIVHLVKGPERKSTKILYPDKGFTAIF